VPLSLSLSPRPKQYYLHTLPSVCFLVRPGPPLSPPMRSNPSSPILSLSALSMCHLPPLHTLSGPSPFLFDSTLLSSRRPFSTLLSSLDRPYFVCAMMLRFSSLLCSFFIISYLFFNWRYLTNPSKHGTLSPSWNIYGAFPPTKAKVRLRSLM